MSKNRKTPTQFDALKKAAHDAYVADLRDGRKFRAQTFANRKAVQSKNACRKGAWA